jgi:fido (protein-threonine AMPylation protein)
MTTTPTDEEVKEFLKESNEIEREYSQEAMDDAEQAWFMAVINARDFDTPYLLGIHRRLLKRLAPHYAGKIRDFPVYIGGERRDQNKEEIKKELAKLFKKWRDNKETLKDMPDSTKELFVKEWHIKYEKIHPFGDGNGRTGRILMNIQRLTLNLPLMIIHTGPEQFKYYTWFKENGIKNKKD